MFKYFPTRCICGEERKQNCEKVTENAAERETVYAYVTKDKKIYLRICLERGRAALVIAMITRNYYCYPRETPIIPAITDGKRGHLCVIDDSERLKSLFFHRAASLSIGRCPKFH